MIRMSVSNIFNFFMTGDMTSPLAKINTFILSNIAPQYKKHNTEVWNNWENYTRNKTMKKGFLFVITGVTGDAKK